MTGIEESLIKSDEFYLNSSHADMAVKEGRVILWGQCGPTSKISPSTCRGGWGHGMRRAPIF